MNIGSIIEGRFQLRERAAQGGMGTIFRATDLQTGLDVALKVISDGEPALTNRFLVESQILATLNHPCIVRHVAHGVLGDGSPYLAMHWLEGQDLSHALRERAFSTLETLVILRRIAEGLQCAHQHGVIHRDLKPGNIVLVQSDPSQATLVDFGVARPTDISRQVTQTGAIIGTVGYMSPEQWQGSKLIDGRADLFSLGCVAFECLTGQSAFGADNIAAVVARVLLGETPRVRSISPDVSQEIDDFVATLMHSDPAHRYANAQVVIDQLTKLIADNASAQSGPTQHVARPLSLERERSPMAAVLCWNSVLAKTKPALSVDNDESPHDLGTRIAERWDGAMTLLVGGALLFLFSKGVALRENVERAARASLDLRLGLPEWNISLTLTQAESRGPMHDRRALQHLLPAEGTTVDDLADELQHKVGVAIDDGSERMLGENFVVVALDSTADAPRVLLEYRPERDESRKVLGRDCPCIGREKELRFMEATLDQVQDERSQSMLFLLGTQGLGKSRIRREWMARVAERPGLKVVLSKSDVGTKLTSFALLKQWLHSAHPAAFESAPDHSAERRWQRFAREFEPIIARALDGESDAGAPQKALDFLGELAGVRRFPLSHAVQDAQEQPREMWSQLSHAFAVWLRGECASNTVALVLEDLHWADSASVSLLTQVWDQLSDCPLFVLVTAWPEAEATFGTLFRCNNSQTISLDPIGKKSAEKIVTHLLGADCTESVRRQVVDLAGGNGFLLEEIIRHVGTQHALDTLPPLGLALVQARLHRLAPESRRVLRLASVIGERFYRETIESITGTIAPQSVANHRTEPSLDAIFSQLKHDELLTPEGPIWAFRHSQIRQAAYEMLAEADRAQAHFAVAQWLEEHSASTPALIADHYEKANALDRAGPWFHAAILQAERLGHLESINALVALCDRPGIPTDLRASAIFHGFYVSMSAGTRDFINELDARLSLGDVPPGSPGWLLLKAFQIVHKQHQGAPISVRDEVAAILKSDLALQPTAESVQTYSVLLGACMQAELLTEATIIGERFASLALDPSTQPWLVCTRDSYLPLLYTANDDPRALTTNRACVELARNSCSTHKYVELASGYITHAIEFGAFEECDAVLRQLYTAPIALNGYLFDNVVYAEAKLAAYRDKPMDAEHLIAKVQRPEMRHQTLRIRAFSVASAAFARPDDRTCVAEQLAKLEQIVRDCEQMERPKFIALLLCADLTVLLGDFRRTLQITDALLPRNTATPSGQRTRLALARLRALRGLDHQEQCATELRTATVRLATIADKMQGADRDNFLAMPAVRDTLGFELG